MVGSGIEPRTSGSIVRRSTDCATRPGFNNRVLLKLGDMAGDAHITSGKEQTPLIEFVIFISLVYSYLLRNPA